jgi:DNA polymerase III gamma/tau subunit
LRDTIATAPSQLDYKVYIIDEAHMLTREAFNALLKTLEEPPEHVIFILATTEVHKLPETIVSRTQRYDFRPINQSDMSAQLKNIAKSEKIKITDDAIESIVAYSHGGFRDAISLLDQLSVLEGEITVEQVGQFLGRVNEASLLQLLTSMQNGQAAQTIDQLKEITDSGYDGLVITQQLLDILRHQLLQASKQNNQTNMEFSRRAMSVLVAALGNFKITNHPSLPLELAVIEIAQGPLKSDPVQNRSAKPVGQKTTVKAEVEPAPRTIPKNNSEVERLCTKALSLIKQHNNSLYAVLRSAKYYIEGDEFVVVCRFSFHKERIEEPRNRAMIEKAMTKVFERPIELRCETEKAESQATVNANNELIDSAMAILGGELVDGE